LILKGAGGSIFFAKTLQFSHRTAFWLLKVSLMNYSFYASHRRSQQRFFHI